MKFKVGDFAQYNVANAMGANSVSKDILYRVVSAEKQNTPTENYEVIYLSELMGSWFSWAFDRVDPNTLTEFEKTIWDLK